MLDFYKAIKISFHELKEVNLKTRALESRMNVQESTAKARDQGVADDMPNSGISMISVAKEWTDFNKLEDRVRMVENKVSSLDAALMGIADQSYKIMKASNEHVKILLGKLEKSNEDRSIIHLTDVNAPPVENPPGPSRRTRANYNRKASYAASKVKELKIVANNMNKMELEAAELLKNIG